MVSAMWGGEWDVRRFAEIGSTNTYLREQGRLGAPDGLVAVADHQTAGRGRLDRRWEAPPGSSLLLSVLFRPELDPAQLHLCTAALALAAAAACREVAGVRPDLKWPNDLLVGEAKLAGVLAEAEFAAGDVAFVVVGIGLNLAWPGPPGVGGTCLDDLTPPTAAPIGRDALLGALLAELSLRRGRMDHPEGRAALAAEMRRCCATLGRPVRIETAAGPVEGRAATIDDAGHLVVDTAEGPRRVAAGDTVHLRAQGQGTAPSG
jgi:BirA family transcriptional regulator, biotin operon repressor / biotin---[acetyl-CoA-carboxylase] ligase